MGKDDKKALIVFALAGFFGFLENDVKTLQSLGYKVYCATKNNNASERSKESIIKANDVQVVNVNFDSKKIFSKDNLIAYKQLKKLFKENKFDVVHCHTPIAGAITRLAMKKYRRRNKTKIFYTTHGFSFTKYSSKKEFKKYFSIEKYFSKFTDVIITINDEDFNYAKQMKSKAVEKINGVGFDYDRFHNVDINRSEYRKSLGVTDTDIMILSVGELSSRKNHQVIIKAISKIKNPNIVYVIAGKELAGSGTKEELISLAEKLNVRLILLGHRPDIPEIIKCSDIGAIPSIREGLGLAGVQSLACGVPLVGTDVQGIREYIINDKTGYLCDAFDENDCAEKIKLLLENKSKMIENCYEISQNFSITVSKRQMEEIYTKSLRN